MQNRDLEAALSYHFFVFSGDVDVASVPKEEEEKRKTYWQIDNDLRAHNCNAPQTERSRIFTSQCIRGACYLHRKYETSTAREIYLGMNWQTNEE